MIVFEEAYSNVINNAVLLGKERTALLDSIGRVLAEDVFSDMDMPPFNKSAVDGYACRRVEMFNDLEVIETVAAGKVPKKNPGKNQCIKIMTGGMVPVGLDTVLMVEYTTEVGENTIRFVEKKSRSNICIRAEDIKTGDIVINAGTLIKPQDIAVLASVGYMEPLMYHRPEVAVISTGDELVEPSFKPVEAQIRNSNGAQLMAQLKKIGINGNYLGIASDDREALHEIIELAIRENDIVLVTGGVSMGDYDYVPDVLKDLGVNVIFKSVAIQPGRPTVFGTHESSLFFGLPGNPVSSFVLFEILVKPMIYKMMGHDLLPSIMKLPMAKEFSRKKSSRKSLIPVVITQSNEVLPVEYHGSAHIHSYLQAHGMVIMEIGQTKLEKGEIVDVRQI